MRHEALEYLKELLEKKYGSLDDDSGVYMINDDGEDEWLSLREIARLIDKADEEA